MSGIGARHIAGGLAVLAAGVVGGQMLAPSLSPAEAKRRRRRPTEAQRRATFDSIAPSYDKDIGTSEWLSGYDAIRARLLTRAHGPS